jgi:hypothetical protein
MIRVPLDQPTIQAAINAAANGDTVLVLPGTYVENINFSGKSITVTSEAGPEVTLIDGNRADSVVKFNAGEGRASVLSGFTIFNGRSGFDTAGFGAGGGIWIQNASPTITGNIVANNRGCNGIGIGSQFGSPLIQRNTIVNNRREGCTGGTGGGGITIDNDATPRPRSEILDNVVAGNVVSSGDGGGIWVGTNAVIRGNIVTGNSASGSSPCTRGGGINAAGDTQVVQNLISGNRAGCGGGLFLQNSSGEGVVANTIADNDGALGSGVYTLSTLGFSPTLADNVIVANAGQAAVHCVNNNTGSPPPNVRSSDAFAPSGSAYGGICTDQTGQNGNLSADPLFVDPAAGNFRLQAPSPAIDAGSSAPLLPSRDLDGNARTGGVDMGAYDRGAFLAPASHDFGPVPLDASAESVTFTIANPGASAVTISAISIANRAVGAGGSAGFSLTPGGSEPCPGLSFALAPGQSCTVVVEFAAGHATGSKGATLRIDADVPGSPIVAALSATVVVASVLSSSVGDQTTSSQAAFTFSSNVDGVTFECRFDGQEWFACTSPRTRSGLGVGTYSFEMRTVSKLGDRDPTPAVHTWRVVPRAKRFDFNGDGFADVLWRNLSTGENYLFPMLGTAILPGEGYLRTVADQSWQIAGTGDFDGDGRADILWRNSSSGENYVYFMNGISIAKEGYLRTVADQNWQVAGVGDFDSDGKQDLLWRHTGTGENYVYLMNGLSIVNEGYLRTVADAAWQVAGVGDFDGNGRADILWRNASSGENYIYFMSGLSIANEGYLRSVPVPDWQIKGVGDFDGYGGADILWRNGTSGENYLATQSPFTEGYLRTVGDLAWQIAAAGDYDGDGKADILWRNATTGQNYLFPMNGTAIKPTEGYLRSVSPGGWSIVAR